MLFALKNVGLAGGKAEELADFFIGEMGNEPVFYKREMAARVQCEI